MNVLVDVQPHDLLRMDPSALRVKEGDSWPIWVGTAVAMAPWAVVRHANAPPGFLPVGIRGMNRGARWGTELSMSGVLEVMPPESLRTPESWDVLPEIPAVRSLRAVAPVFERSGSSWGPAGSVGFSIATGVIVCNQNSDLDILLRHPTKPQSGELEQLANFLDRQESRVDCQVATPAGIAHLRELVNGQPVLVRSPNGPSLCADPWLGQLQ